MALMRDMELNGPVRFIGPVTNLNRALEVMKSLGFVDASDYVPWREAFPKFAQNERGTILRGARLKEDLTHVQLAERVEIPQRHISENEYILTISLILRHFPIV